MTDGLDLQIGTYEHRLNHLLRDGLDLHRNLRTGDRDLGEDLQAMKMWQRECAATISQLSGGSKQHWLSRAYSEAFLPDEVRDGASQPDNAVETPVDAIVARIMGVLQQAQASLAGMRETGAAPQASPAPRRFAFVHDADLRPRLEHALVDGQAAFDRGSYGLALVTWASILEAILTDALTYAQAEAVGSQTGAEPVAAWSFDARIQAAEEARLISAGCARLPALARNYRAWLDERGELRPEIPAAEADAKRTSQVLRLIMRDLSPGR